MLVEILTKYMQAFHASQYLIQLSHLDKQAYKPIRVTYTPEQLLNSSEFFKHKNAMGYNVYARPVGYEFILLDDLKKQVLLQLSALQPCLVMETSPDNYQAFLTLPKLPECRQQAVQICRELAVLFDADPGSAEPDHVGRLPGLTNRKEKYRNSKGLYPFVKLHQAEKRISNFIPQWRACAQTISRPSPAKTGIDRSLQDFIFVCRLLRQGKSDVFIVDALLDYSEKARERGPKYIFRTIQNARKTIL